MAAALNIADTDGSGLLEIPDATNARGLREVGCLPDAGPGLTEPSARLISHTEENHALVGNRRRRSAPRWSRAS